MRLNTISLKAANEFVATNHRHHKPVVGHKFSLAAIDGDGKIIGVVIVGRPVSRFRDNGVTLEITRLCTDGTKNACSFLCGAAVRAGESLGYEKIGTYTLPSEGGASLRASGWMLIGERGGGTWNRKTRSRDDKAPLEVKHLWEKTLENYSTVKKGGD